MKTVALILTLTSAAYAAIHGLSNPTSRGWREADVSIHQDTDLRLSVSL